MTDRRKKRPSKPASTEAFAVGPESARMLELGHPWVVADAWTRKWPKGRPGDLVELVDPQGRRLATALLDPGEKVCARVLERGARRLDGEWVRERISRALELRAAHADLEGTEAWRVVNGEGDGLPGVTVDRYGAYLMVQLYTEAWKPHLPKVTGALEKLFPEAAGLYVKPRPQKTRRLAAEADTRRYSRLVSGAPAESRFPVRENDLHFLVDLEEGLNTGLFFDQRRHRRDLMGRVAGKRFLNLFAYTGAFSVAAAAAGASSVVSVDASRHYLDWARENFGCNRLNPKRHEFLVEDCFAALEGFRRQRRLFDIILMDPPSFSTTGKSRFTTRKGTAELVAAALPLLERGGLLLASSNHQKTDVAGYLKELRRGALQAGSDLRVIALSGQPEDFPYPVTFPEGRYLKYVKAVKA